MGFSISGSFAILVVAGIVAFGMLYGASASRMELSNEAKQTEMDDQVAAGNTDIEVVDFWTNGVNLWVNVTNTGTRTLSVNDTDLILDGVYQERPFDSQRVDGDSETDLWQPGEKLVMRLTVEQPNDPPDRTKVVTEHGVSDVEVR